MLQQTQVARVVPRYEAWLERWPSAADVAQAPRAEVLRAWVGLGYNRRALRLREACRVVAADGWPRSSAGLRALPGIGPYTAAAVASFAFGEQVAAVDTNVRRVAARIGRGTPDELLPAGDAASWNQALMELGATVCTARAPRCGLCPLSSCAWRSLGYPAATAQARRPQRYAGTDRQVRGRLLDVLRASDAPVTRTELDVAWLTDTAQRDRALDSLLVDGLVEQTADGRFALAGEGGHR